MVLCGLLTGAILLGINGCTSKDSSEPAPPPQAVNGPVTLLTSGNPSGDDDDPAVAVDAQGTVHVVWFSDRDGTKDLYTVHSTAFDLASGTITWSAPVQITHNDPGQFPNPTQRQFPLIGDRRSRHFSPGLAPREPDKRVSHPRHAERWNFRRVGVSRSKGRLQRP
jgi:hypothetical protein